MRESSRRGRAGLGRSSLTCSTEGKAQLQALPPALHGKCFLAKSATVSSVNKERTPLSYKGPSGLKLPLVVRKLATLEKSKHLRVLPLPGQEQGANARAHRCVWTPLPWEREVGSLPLDPDPAGSRGHHRRGWQQTTLWSIRQWCHGQKLICKQK